MKNMKVLARQKRYYALERRPSILHKGLITSSYHCTYQQSKKEKGVMHWKNIKSL